MTIYLESNQYDQILYDLGYKELTNSVYVGDQDEPFITKLLDLLNKQDPFGYSIDPFH